MNSFYVYGRSSLLLQSKMLQKEFLRILKPNGFIILIWNVRKSEDHPFSVEYDKLLKTHIPEYLKVSHRNIDLERVRNFTGPINIQEFSCQNV